MRKEFQRITPEEAGIKSKDLLQFVKMIQHDKTQMHGLMAMKDGKIFLESWWAPFGKEFPHSCHSMGKSYTCTAIGIACTEGLMTMEDRIADIFKDEIERWNIHQTKEFEELRVKHVVTMSNGMAHMSPLSDDWICEYLKNPVVYKPGTRFLYNTAGSCMLAVIVKKVTGQDVFSYLNEKLFSKIGIDPCSIEWLKFHDGNIAEPGCFSLTENNLRLGLLYVNGGKWEGEQIVDEAWIKDALRVHIDNAEMPGGEDLHCGYGYQLWKCKYPGAFRFDGGQGQFCIMVPEKNLLVAINEGGVEPYGPARTLDIVYEYLLDKIQDIPLSEDAETSGDREELSAYLRSLHVKEDAANCFFPKIDRFSGSYQTQRGNVTPWIGVSPGGYNFFESFYDLTKKEKMTDFTLKVSEEKVLLTVDGYADFEAWFDGRIRVHETDSVLPGLRRTYSTARFEGEDTLSITIHWIAGWFVTIMTFEYLEDGYYRICASKNILNEERPFFTEEDVAIPR